MKRNDQHTGKSKNCLEYLKQKNKKEQMREGKRQKSTGDDKSRVTIMKTTLGAAKKGGVKKRGGRKCLAQKNAKTDINEWGDGQP